MARKTIGYTELEWTCPNCGTKNPGTQKICSACGGPQPDDVKFEQAQHQKITEDEEKIKIAKQGPDIHCGFCGARNPGNAEVCVQCGGNLSEGKARKSGQVVGAFSSKKPPKEIICPSCGAANPGTQSNCSQCGSDLRPPTTKAKNLQAQTVSKPKEQAKKKNSKPLIIGLIILALLAVFACIIFAVLAGTTKESKTATVEAIYWERSVEIEEFLPVEKEDWKDDIPAEAIIGNCQLKHSTTQDSPAPISTEVCGTPYTEDTGSGMGEVVQDCQYEVYEDYCDYTIEEWTIVDTVVLQGNDLSPDWPNPNLFAQQRIRQNSENEEYTITFDAGSENYTYTTSDFQTFSQCEYGSKWTLNINTFGNIKSIEPAN